MTLKKRLRPLILKAFFIQNTVYTEYYIYLFLFLGMAEGSIKQSIYADPDEKKYVRGKLIF